MNEKDYGIYQPSNEEILNNVITLHNVSHVIYNAKSVKEFLRCYFTSYNPSTVHINEEKGTRVVCNYGCARSIMDLYFLYFHYIYSNSDEYGFSAKKAVKSYISVVEFIQNFSCIFVSNDCVLRIRFCPDIQRVVFIAVSSEQVVNINFNTKHNLYVHEDCIFSEESTGITVGKILKILDDYGESKLEKTNK